MKNFHNNYYFVKFPQKLEELENFTKFWIFGQFPEKNSFVWQFLKHLLCWNISTKSCIVAKFLQEMVLFENLNQKYVFVINYPKKITLFCLKGEIRNNQFCLNLLQSHMEISEDFQESLRNLSQVSIKLPQNCNWTYIRLPLLFLKNFCIPFFDRWTIVKS